ncbi:tetratricopeptide repeat protein [Streptomyces sp. NPDC057460]|uniref:tetratricopeptide repeat protein n=1 Tax=Streptomyces sp. NPDC057460 TaxID=3346141 RepID=UPI00368F299F
MRRHVLDAETRHLGTDHPDTLNSRNNQANVLGDLGEYRQAVDLYRQNLADTERILGTDHPDTLTSRNNLALAEDELTDASSRRRRRPWRR